MQKPTIDFDGIEYMYAPMVSEPVKAPNIKHPYKGANGNMYDKESDAIKTFGDQSGKPRWILTTSFFDPPHYRLIEFVI